MQLSRPNLTTAEPFSDTFGPKAQRKRPRIDVGSFEELAHSGLTKLNPKLITILAAESVEGGDAEAEGSSIAEISYAHDQDLGMDEKNEVQRQHQDDSELRTAPLDYILAAGTSKRIWAELYKVIDSSDIILHVLDARDPLGTRCHSVENYLAKEKRSKKVIYILNKVDLIPGWAAVSQCPPLMLCTLYACPLLLQSRASFSWQSLNPTMNCQVYRKSPLRKTAIIAGRLAAETTSFSCVNDRYVHGRRLFHPFLTDLGEL